MKKYGEISTPKDINVANESNEDLINMIERHLSRITISENSAKVIKAAINEIRFRL